MKHNVLFVIKKLKNVDYLQKSLIFTIPENKTIATIKKIIR